MKIVVLNGMEQKGCTYNMKEMFLQSMGEGNEVEEYYFPKDCPVFCTGCKACFNKNIFVCPHKEYITPIWESILKSDLIVIASPSYCFGATAQIKAVLDHFGTKWMSHSPEKELFRKQAIVITNAIGAGMKGAVKTISNSLHFWGISKVYTIKQALFDAKWELVSDKRKNNILKQCQKVGKKINKHVGRVKVSVKTKIIFYVMRMAQNMIHKSEIKKGHSETQDHKFWVEQGYFSSKKPWKTS